MKRSQYRGWPIPPEKWLESSEGEGWDRILDLAEEAMSEESQRRYLSTQSFFRRCKYHKVDAEWMVRRQKREEKRRERRLKKKRKIRIFKKL